MFSTRSKSLKSLFFIALVIAITVISSWDYTGSYRLWNKAGVPLSTVAALICYGYMYWVFIPVYRQTQSHLKIGLYELGFLLLYVATHLLITRFLISDDEYLKVYKWLRPSEEYIRRPDPDINFNLISGVVVLSPVYFFLYAFLANWHRRQNLIKRMRRWWNVGLKNLWKREQENLSWIHFGWLVLGWSVWLFFNIFPSLVKGRDVVWSTTLLMLLPSIFFFYINLKTNFSLLAKNKILLALLSSLFLWAILLVVKGIWFLVITKNFGFPAVINGVNIYDDLKMKEPDTRLIYTSGIVIGYFSVNYGLRELIILLASFIYGYGRRAVLYQQELRVLAKNRQQELLKQKALEKEVIDARLQSLKYQINPHFLFNSLNFLYSQALPLSDDLARATMLLSKMMRYGLQENSEEAKVALTGEVEHVHNFIEFNQLRFSNQLQIDFQVQGNIAIRRIMPLLLITFVENAFKYGELQEAENPLQIHLSVNQEKLRFFVKNKKRNGPKEDSTGIGLENIKKRLLLGYPSRHTLDITENDNFFTTELVIIL